MGREKLRGKLAEEENERFLNKKNVEESGGLWTSSSRTERNINEAGEVWMRLELTDIKIY